MSDLEILEQEVTDYIESEYHINHLSFDDEKKDDGEMSFKLKPNMDIRVIKEGLRLKFKDHNFFLTNIGGILGVLIEGLQ